MKKIMVGIVFAVLFGSFAIALAGLEIETTLCETNGHQKICFTYSFGTYCYCIDNYRNECYLNNYETGNCRLFEGFTIDDEKYLDWSSNPNFTAFITKCSKDNECSMITSTRCPCSMGGNQIAVNKKGAEYWNWYRETFYLGEGNLCTAEIKCWNQESYCNKLTKTCELR